MNHTLLFAALANERCGSITLTVSIMIEAISILYFCAVGLLRLFLRSLKGRSG
jgi:hypothetical protein